MRRLKEMRIGMSKWEGKKDRVYVNGWYEYRWRWCGWMGEWGWWEIYWKDWRGWDWMIENGGLWECELMSYERLKKMREIEWEVVDMNGLNVRRGGGRENGGYEYRWMNEWGWMNEWMNEWMRMNENEWEWMRMNENEWRQRDMIWGEGLD